MHVYKCSATCAGSWSDLGAAIIDTGCITSGTDLTGISLSYDSTNNDLIAFVVGSDGTNEKVCFRKSTDMGSSWESTIYDMGFASTAIAQVSSVEAVADPSKLAVTVYDATAYKFATVPERGFLFALLPFVPGFFKKLKKKKKYEL